jgi:hypothetical protein
VDAPASHCHSTAALAGRRPPPGPRAARDQRTASRGNRQWLVKHKLFVRERPLRRADLEALGEHPPQGSIPGPRVDHVLAQGALLADDQGLFFTPHFDGFPRSSWKRLARSYLDGER